MYQTYERLEKHLIAWKIFNAFKLQLVNRRARSLDLEPPIYNTLFIYIYIYVLNDLVAISS